MDASGSPATFRPPVFDAHVDSLQRALDLGHDLGQVTPGHLDLVRGARAGLASVVFVCWCDPRYLAPEGGGARRRSARLLGAFQRLVEGHPQRVSWAGNGTLLDGAHAAGRVAGIPGIEGGHSIEGSLEHLEWFFEHGVRVLTLVWNNHLPWVRSCQDGAGPEVPAGLSDFGVQVVRHMNELGMVVDLSHAGERSFYDALEASERPVIASHSGCRALADNPRNLTDDQLRALAGAGGVMGVVFCTAFLDEEAYRLEGAAREEPDYQALEGENETEQFLIRGEYLQRSVPPLSLERVVDHVLHAAEVCGVEHVGLGSDYDGILRCPAGLEDASCYGRLAQGLLARGLAEEEVAEVMGGNMERVFRAATGPGTRAATAPLRPLSGVDEELR